MGKLDEREARKHPAYNDALWQATARAATGAETAVYWDGVGIFVRDAHSPRPENAEVICIAQKWDDKTVQLRFAGAHSEWVKI